MKILCVTPWDNTWVNYWTKYIESRGHELRWLIEQKVTTEEVRMNCQWADVVLCHWADKYAIILSDKAYNTKPLYVILRSYEIFSSDGWSDLGMINWLNVKKLFMLNEAHYPVFKCRVPGIEPIYFKNAVDLDEWKSNGVLKDSNKIAWICDINEKKGVELMVQAIHELTKLNPNITLEHIGRNQDIRRWYYLERIMPKLNMNWFNAGYKNEHDFVKNFLADKKFIISTSIAEGNPMNIIEAMALGVIPLVHAWPGSAFQFPEECIWTTFDELKEVYNRLNSDPEASARMRKFAEERYDYRKNFAVIVDTIEC